MVASLERSIVRWFAIPILSLCGLSIGLIRYFELDLLEGITLLMAVLLPSVLALYVVYQRVFAALAAVAVQLDSLANEEFTVWRLAQYKQGRVAALKTDLQRIATRMVNKRQEYAQNDNFVFDFINELTLPVVVLDGQDQVFHHNQAAADYYQSPWLLGASLSDLGLSEHEQKWQVERHEQRYRVSAHHFLRGTRQYRLLVYVSIEQSLRSNEKEAWQKLLRVLNHEVRNSLTPIYSMAQTLQELTQSEQTLSQTMLSVIEHRAEHLLEFVASYSKLTQLPEANLNAIDVNELTARWAALFPHVAIEVSAQGALCCDVEQLEQALLNLVKNAEQANQVASRDGVTIKVSQPAKWLIEVIDHGEGIAQRDNLFVPFYSTKPDGNGIGLVLSRELIRNQGGELTLANRVDQHGAVAAIILPTLQSNHFKKRIPKR